MSGNNVYMDVHRVFLVGGSVQVQVQLKNWSSTSHFYRILSECRGETAQDCGEVPKKVGWYTAVSTGRPLLCAI